MRTEKLNKGQKADVLLNEVQWSVGEWEKFCKDNDAGLIIEDGKVKGFITNPVEYRL